MTSRRALVFLALTVTISGGNQSMADSPTTKKAKAFLKEHQSKVRPLDIVANLAWWNANTSGKEEDFKKKEQAENRLNAYLSNSKRFKTVK